ncbi:hypothetical protein U9M48_041049 [Paspalum notatum var. saurae]|uniref:Uncharacterized protein n=1 Tax=Paspalum notatum var. saurae TaxID=547442 RepID=A0AAQ3UPP2_PASNO
MVAMTVIVAGSHKRWCTAFAKTSPSPGHHNHHQLAPVAGRAPMRRRPPPVLQRRLDPGLASLAPAGAGTGGRYEGERGEGREGVEMRQLGRSGADERRRQRGGDQTG